MALASVVVGDHFAHLMTAAVGLDVLGHEVTTTELAAVLAIAVDHHPLDPHAARSPAAGAAGRARGVARRVRAGRDPRAGHVVSLARGRRPGGCRPDPVVAGGLAAHPGRPHGRAAGVLPGAAHRRRRRRPDAAGARVPGAPPRRPAANGPNRHVAGRGGDGPAHNRLPRPRPRRQPGRVGRDPAGRPDPSSLHGGMGPRCPAGRARRHHAALPRPGHPGLHGGRRTAAPPARGSRCAARGAGDAPSAAGHADQEPRRRHRGERAAGADQRRPRRLAGWRLRHGHRRDPGPARPGHRPAAANGSGRPPGAGAGSRPLQTPRIVRPDHRRRIHGGRDGVHAGAGRRRVARGRRARARARPPALAAIAARGGRRPWASRKGTSSSPRPRLPSRTPTPNRATSSWRCGIPMPSSTSRPRCRAAPTARSW